MKRLFIIGMLSLLSLLPLGCELETSPALYEKAKEAFIAGDYEDASQILLAALQKDTNANATSLKEMVLESAYFTEPHPMLASCDNMACKLALQTYASESIGQIEQGSLEDFSFVEYQSVAKLLYQSKQGVMLTSCIMLDVLNLMERQFGHSGTLLKQKLTPMIHQLRSLQLSPASVGQEALFKLAEERGRQNPTIKNCGDISQEYNQLKTELKRLSQTLNLSFDASQNNAAQSVFMQSVINARLDALLKNQESITE